MTNELQLFNYKGATIRTVKIDGDVWLVAKDVCDVLELSDVSMSVRGLDDDEKGTSSICTLGGNQSMTVINEPGLYKLTFKSRKPEAKEFTRWVTHEVLPQIRRTGSYSMKAEQPALPSGVMDGARMIFEAAGIKDNQLSLALDNVYASYTGRSALKTGNVTLAAPTQNQLLTPTQIGDEFGLSARRVNEKLAYAGYQHKIAGKWEPIGAGKQYGVMIDVGKRYKGTPVRQLKWDSGILSVFGRMLNE